MKFGPSFIRRGSYYRCLGQITAQKKSREWTGIIKENLHQLLRSYRQIVYNLQEPDPRADKFSVGSNLREVND